MDVLRTCISLDEIVQALKSLPKTLDETYERVLLRIPAERVKDALRILQWLVFSARPLRINEVAELLVANPERKPEFDLDRRPFNPQIIASYCGSLITTQTSTEEIRLAHYSVQEFLVSDRIIEGPCANYKITKSAASSSIVKTCLTYLMGAAEPRVPVLLRGFPLAEYAAQCWIKHAKAAEATHIDDIDDRVVRFLKCEQVRSNWIQLFDPDDPWRGPNKGDKARVVNPPLYYASLAGLQRSVKILLDSGADVDARARDGGTALTLAAENGHEAVVRLLLEYRADVNAEARYGGTALTWAAKNGHEAVVRLLLKHRADVDAKGHYGRTALTLAAENGHEAVVRLLLEHRADVDARLGYGGTALTRAAENGHEAVVRLLLEHRADVDVKDDYGGTALTRAAENGHEAVVRLLLEHRADVDARDGDGGTALTWAAENGHEAVVLLLVEHRADVDARDGDGGTALT
jgi:ankyrin repeat protein